MSQHKNVYVAYTGGTIGMRRSAAGYRPAPGFLGEQMAAMPELRNEEMPAYEIHEYPRLLDSSNMTPAEWVTIGEDLLAHYERYDGFIVLHGTDTMAYSASALSFMLANLGKPVIFTGSQIPLMEIRNDARNNLITSLLIAAGEPIPEVCLLFGNQLLRGNRASKVSSTGFRAFDSPNFPPLGRVGVRIEIDHELVLPPPVEPLRFDPIGTPPIANVRLFPGLNAGTLEQLLAPPTRGAVLHTYGLGNAPERPDFLEVVHRATDRGVVIVNCTQCLRGMVDMAGYATGRALAETGVISGFDMTPEAATCKLAYLLTLCDDPDEARRQMQESLRGELSRPQDTGAMRKG